MKKMRILLLLVAAICLTVSACRRHSTIIETGDNYYMKIEYSGSVHFSIDGRTITGISHGGYLKYQRNEKKLEARNDGNGGVRFELLDYGDPVAPKDQKAFIANAVRVMLQKNHHPDWN